MKTIWSKVNSFFGPAFWRGFTSLTIFPDRRRFDRYRQHDARQRVELAWTRAGEHLQKAMDLFNKQRNR